jgi:hypothetical protein
VWTGREHLLQPRRRLRQPHRYSVNGPHARCAGYGG